MDRTKYISIALAGKTDLQLIIFMYLSYIEDIQILLLQFHTQELILGFCVVRRSLLSFEVRYFVKGLNETQGLSLQRKMRD